MPVNTINGWTSMGLSPSYSVLASILHSAGGTPTQAATPAPASTSTSAPKNILPGVTPMPKNPYGGGFAGGATYGTGSLIPNGRSPINSALNPQEAYSQYLQNRAILEGSTPQQSAYNIAVYQHQLLNDADPSGIWRNPDAGQIGRPQDAFLQQQQFQSDLATRMFNTASPYSYAQGVAPANAPAPPPRSTGYSSGWTPAGGGFGFGGGGFGY